ncbi:unnamed protein product [Amoebophrya sp. A25]|nr:unnamed protein product [Amoebophrya sp. A25]|eukprot:GSA25T00008812001.1
MPGKQTTILVGPPGSGKSTIAPYLSSMFDRPLLTLDGLIAQEISRGTESGKYLALCQKEGRTPDDITLLSLFKAEMEASCPLGCFMCDFPRTLSQAQALDRYLIKTGNREYLKLYELSASDSFCEGRVRSRYIHPGSGRIYNSVSFPPKEEGKDDETGEDLIQLEKDHRLRFPKEVFIYHLSCEPQLKHFGASARIDCLKAGGEEKTVEDMVTEIAHNLLSSTFARRLTFAERNAAAIGAAPPEATNAKDAETRVYDRGDHLERKAPVLEVKTKHGGDFAPTAYHTVN